ncbi:hypothetical protein BIW11_08332 [Tropilaelaps mercedesae]|uniref:Ig-like domain-containing protein n=1 Tax=Tropilaelaps mercedesae TaxID=418985 RepID=A0A1V9XPZ2_9ACAR|nr:hypothetical protein BIW11_08332 [Tropilaelaps mercedesae]
MPSGDGSSCFRPPTTPPHSQTLGKRRQVTALSETSALSVELLIPPVALGRSAQLNCSRKDTKERRTQEAILSVRWFRNGDEFFRFDRRTGEKLLFELPGLYVDVHSSHDGVLRLKRTSPESEAMFACELTTSHFRIGKAEAALQLYGKSCNVSLPWLTFCTLPSASTRRTSTTGGQDAVLSRGKFQRDVWTHSKAITSSDVDHQWTAGQDRSSSQASWGNSPPTNAVVTEQAEEHNGLSTVFSRLTFNTSTLPEDQLELKVVCTADVLDVYNRSAERRAAFVRLGTPASNAINDGGSFETEAGPVIYGGRSHYHVGDVLNATCVFAGPEAVSLRWLLNEHSVPQQSLLHFLEEQTSSGVVRTALGIRFRVYFCGIATRLLWPKRSQALVGPTRGAHPDTKGGADVDEGGMRNQSRRPSAGKTSPIYQPTGHQVDATRASMRGGGPAPAAQTGSARQNATQTGKLSGKLDGMLLYTFLEFGFAGRH